MRILTFSSLYPNEIDPTHGIFVERRLRELTENTELSASVVAPVPWFPFRSRVFGRYAEFATVPKRGRRHGIDVYYPRYPVIPKIGMLATPGLMTRSTWRTVQHVVEKLGDVRLIDAHYFYPDGIAASRLARRLGLPYVITARGSDVNLIGELERPRQMMVEAAADAKAVIAVSEALAARLGAIGVEPSKIHVLRNGVDLEFFHPGDRAARRNELGFHSPTMISVGALKETKGHHLAIEALPGLPDVRLVIIGSGEYERELRSLVARLDLATRVHFAGRLDPQALLPYYQAADALCLASLREGMPNVVLESVACGTPVIATDVGGIGEVVENGVMGELLAERSSTAVASAWKRLMQRGVDRDDIRRRAEALSWTHTVDGLRRLFLSHAS